MAASAPGRHRLPRPAGRAHLRLVTTEGPGRRRRRAVRQVVVTFLVTGLIVLALGAILIARAGAASALPPGCVSQPWGFLGSQTRQLCDGPIRADGSWLRERIVGRAGYWANARSSCYGGYYSSSCTYYPAGWVPEYHSNEETYVVFPFNVLPDEPGHIG